ncbi:hypothetical protein DH2020_040608 [Rehmannia glutinosa]|uniref:Uncharacterized protein n=1 Tax=Rehmannia glutinosa TaxID=99300 RepID=A0ABR0UTM8_REHGL
MGSPIAHLNAPFTPIQPKHKALSSMQRPKTQPSSPTITAYGVVFGKRIPKGDFGSGPRPRVLVDPESPIRFKVFDDHIEVKLVLLLPVDHPLVSNFDSILNLEDNRDELRPFSVDSGKSFKEMPSVNWRDVADNWCMPLEYSICSFVQERYSGMRISDVQIRQNLKPDLNSPRDKFIRRVSPDEVCTQVRADCCGNHGDEVLGVDKTVKTSYSEDGIMANAGTSKHLVDADSLSCTFSVLQIKENKALMNEESQNNDIRLCCPDVLVTPAKVQMNEVNGELLEKRKMFLDGYLGNGFMVRSSGFQRYSWIKFLCPQCSCIVGAYPCIDDNVPLDGGVRLFKCCISTCLPLDRSDDAFGSDNFSTSMEFTE